MGKPIAEHLADYLLGLAQGPWSIHYARKCYAMWQEKYGETVVISVKKIVTDRRKK